MITLEGGDLHVTDPLLCPNKERTVLLADLCNPVMCV